MNATITLAELTEMNQTSIGRIDIEITGHASIGSNRWRYEWRRVVPDTDGQWIEDTEQPLTSASEGYGYAYNTIETRNNGSGIEGSGDDMSEPGSQYNVTMLPIGIGAVLPNAILFETQGGDLEVYFSDPNNLTGHCPGG